MYNISKFLVYPNIRVFLRQNELIDERVLLFHLKFDGVFSFIVSNRFKVVSEIITTLANDRCIGQLLKYGTPQNESNELKPPKTTQFYSETSIFCNSDENS